MTFSATTGQQLKWIPLTALAPIIWGTTYIVTTHLLPSEHPLFSAVMRTLFPGILALAITRVLPSGIWWVRSFVLGLLNMGIFFPLLFITAEHLPGGTAATLGATQPLLVAFLAVFLLGEKLSSWRLTWGIIGVVGVCLVVLSPQASFDLIGICAGVLSSASMGTGVVLAKKWGRPSQISALTYAGWQLSAAGIVLLIPALLTEGIPYFDTRATIGYAWLGLAGALISYTLWFTGIQKLSVTPTAMLGLLSPLTATFLGIVIADESMTFIQFLGLLLALCAMFASQVLPSSFRKVSV